jgi:hypothetical protein
MSCLPSRRPGLEASFLLSSFEYCFEYHPNPDKPAQPQARAGTKRDKMIDDKIISKSFCRQLFCLLKSLPKKQRFH